MKKIFALIMTIALVFGVMSISASAEDASENTIINDGQTVFIFENAFSTFIFYTSTYGAKSLFGSIS